MTMDADTLRRLSSLLDLAPTFLEAAGVPVPDIRGIAEQTLAVGPDIQHHRDHTGRVNAARRRINRQLADRHLDAAYTPIADSQDLLGVGKVRVELRHLSLAGGIDAWTLRVDPAPLVTISSARSGRWPCSCSWRSIR